MTRETRILPLPRRASLLPILAASFLLPLVGACSGASSEVGDGCRRLASNACELVAIKDLREKVERADSDSLRDVTRGKDPCDGKQLEECMSAMEAEDARGKALMEKKMEAWKPGGTDWGECVRRQFETCRALDETTLAAELETTTTTLGQLPEKDRKLHSFMFRR